MDIPRTKSGIEGLDEILNGGIPTGASVLVAGGPGTGKSILSLQFLYNGAVQFKEPGILITFETTQKNIRWMMDSFGWDLESLQDENMLKIYSIKPTSPEAFIQRIDKEILGIEALAHEMGAKRLVIDSTTALGVWLESPAIIRYRLFDLIERLKNLGTTSLLTAEVGSTEASALSAFGVEEFITDGVLPLFYKPPNRSIFVRKMRGTKHSQKIHPITIDEKGFTIKHKEEIFWESLK